MNLVVLESVEQRDLNSIYDYIAMDDAAAARRLIVELRNKFLFLLDYPRSGRRRDDLLPGLRSAAVRGYIVLYRVSGDDLEITYVIHGRRDLKQVVTQDRR